MSDEKIVQLSIFVNNEPGQLMKMAKSLKDEKIDIKAFNIAESAGFGVFRAIVKNPEEACTKLAAKNHLVKKTDVIGVVVEKGPGKLYEIAKMLADANINIEYGYADNINGTPTIFARVNDIDSAIKLFKKANIKMLTMKDL